jgi:dipeptidyl aminopeptidase/acylaminoacyl peptidase
MKYIIITFLILFSLSCSNNWENIIDTDSNKALSTEILSWSTIFQEQNDEIISPQEEIIQYSTLSLPTLMQEDITWNDFTLEEVLSTNSSYTRYRISYNNGDIYLSGIMNIPAWDGPFPLIVLNHGYINPRYYTNGRGLKREQDYFARNGFAVIHPDYRNHAFSDKVDEEPYDFRLGYIRDVIASIKALQNSNIAELLSVNSSRIWMLWHSMWSWIAQNIAVSHPDIIHAMVLYWPVSNNEYTNFEKFQLPNPARSERIEQVTNDYQTPLENPTFWAWISSSTFFENIEIPVIIFTGTSDSDTPTQWAQNIYQDLQDAWVESEIISYQWEWHEFSREWSDFMERSKEFFIKNL